MCIRKGALPYEIVGQALPSHTVARTRAESLHRFEPVNRHQLFERVREGSLRRRVADLRVQTTVITCHPSALVIIS